MSADRRATALFASLLLVAVIALIRRLFPGGFADDQIGDPTEWRPRWHRRLALLAGAAILATLRPTSFLHGRNIFVARNIWRELTLVCDAVVIREVSHAQGQC